MAGDAARTNCPQWAMRIYDGLAVATVAFAALAVATGGGAPGPAAGGFERDWADLGLAAAFPALLIVSLGLARRRGIRDYDDYLRRLIGHAAAIGVLATVLVWSSWSILAASWVAPPTDEQLIGILLGSSALAYGIARLRDAR